eukprot:365443-Chlamydomonas_euryale.AAC.11
MVEHELQELQEQSEARARARPGVRAAEPEGLPNPREIQVRIVPGQSVQLPTGASRRHTVTRARPRRWPGRFVVAAAIGGLVGTLVWVALVGAFLLLCGHRIPSSELPRWLHPALGSRQTSQGGRSTRLL